MCVTCYICLFGSEFPKQQKKKKIKKTTKNIRQQHQKIYI